MTTIWPRFITRRLILAGLVGCIGIAGCKDLAGNLPLPAGTMSPGHVQNSTGALQTAVAAYEFFQLGFIDYIQVSGLLTDELTSGNRDKAFKVDGGFNLLKAGTVLVDERQLDQAIDWNPPGASTDKPSTDSLYLRLQQVRQNVAEALGGLAAYAPDSVVVRGELYAMMGYDELWLAEVYCSGVPLSVYTYQGDYTYRAGSTTEQILRDAIAKFDTAQTLAASDAQVVNLAKVGQGRAYLSLGEYTQAGQAVSTVPATFQFADSLVTCAGTSVTCAAPPTDSGLGTLVFRWATGSAVLMAGVSNKEGGTGLPFITSGDPRTADTVIGQTAGNTAQIYFPTKYKTFGINPLVVASGLEAQLITAEADLNAGNAAGMFAILNALRKGNPVTAGMPTLTDPGTFGAEVDTLFTERAAWLFVDGHRQGDLRRLIRNYVNGQGVQVVANQYPSGPYGYGGGLYGTFIDAPVPASELPNPLFTGCLSRD